MQALVANMMFSMLSDYVGSEVSCSSFEDGGVVEYRGVLNKVEAFKGIMVDEDFIPFVKKDKFIKEIVSLEDTRSLFINLN